MSLQIAHVAAASWCGHGCCHVDAQQQVFQRPAPPLLTQSVSWEEPTVSGQAPCPRSGHSLTVVGGRFFLFGGCGRADGVCAATTTSPHSPHMRMRAHLCIISCTIQRVTRHMVVLRRLVSVVILEKQSLPTSGFHSGPGIGSCRSAWKARRTASLHISCLYTRPSPTGKAQAFNDLYELDTSASEEYRWRLIVTQDASGAPPPRARHAALAVRSATAASV